MSIKNVSHTKNILKNIIVINVNIKNILQASSSRSNFLPRENNSGTVFSSWASSYRSDFNTAIYSPSSSPNIPVTPIELNPRVISETNPSDEISDENCVVITTVERRYIYGMLF